MMAFWLSPAGFFHKGREDPVHVPGPRLRIRMWYALCLGVLLAAGILPFGLASGAAASLAPESGSAVGGPPSASEALLYAPSRNTASSGEQSSLEPGITLREDLENIYLGGMEIDRQRALATLALGSFVMVLDDPLARDIRGKDAVTGSPLAAAVSYLGDGRVTLGLCGALATVDPATAYLGANAVILSGLVTQAGKMIFGRARPYVGKGEASFSGPGFRDGYDSLPSGHTASAFALATVLARAYPKYRLLFYGAAVACALARVGNADHWPSDTVLGAAIGIWSAEHVMKRSALFQTRW